MKYLRTYEAKVYKRIKPRVGDYVICTDFTHIKPIEKEFIENTIGKLVDIYRKEDNPYTVYYQNAPEIFSRFGFLVHDPRTNHDDCRFYDREEILFFSPDKDECEAYLAAKKYNL